MTKDGQVDRVKARRVMKKGKSQMPFTEVPSQITPKDQRQQQMCAILAGLRHIKAPVVSCLALAMRLLGSPQYVGLKTVNLGNCRL